MSYTPPSNDNVDLSGSGAYSPPSNDAVDLSPVGWTILIDGQQATGLLDAEDIAILVDGNAIPP